MADVDKTVKIEVDVDAKKAKKGLKGVEKQGERLAKKFKAFSKGAAKFFTTLSVLATGLNQGLELVAKGYEALSQTIGDAVRKAIEFRSENDKTVTTLKEFSLVMQTLQSRVGDVFLPFLEAIANVLGPIVKGTTDWLEANRRIIALRMGAVFVTVATALTKVLFPSIMLTVGAFNIWKIAVRTLQAAFNKAVGGILEKQQELLEFTSQTAEALGRKDLALALKGLGVAAGIAAEDFKSSSQGIIATIKDELRASAELNQSLTTLKNEILKDLAAVWSNLNINVNRDINRNTEDLEKQGETLDKNKVKLEGMNVAQLEQQQQLTEISSQVANSFAASFAALQSGGDAVTDMFKQLAQDFIQVLIKITTKAILANSGNAATGALASQAAIPVVGPALGLTAAATIFTFGKSFLGKIGFADGGLVGRANGIKRVAGGVPGVDSVPILAQRGELVIPPPLTKQLAGLFGRVPSTSGGSGFQAGGVVGSPAGGGGMNFNANFDVKIDGSGQTDPAVMARRFVKESIPMLEQAFRDGQLRFARGT